MSGVRPASNSSSRSPATLEPYGLGGLGSAAPPPAGAIAGGAASLGSGALAPAGASTGGAASGGSGAAGTSWLRSVSGATGPEKFGNSGGFRLSARLPVGSTAWRNSWSMLISLAFLSCSRTSSSSASRTICSTLLWNSRDKVRALRTQKPATRKALGRSFGPITTSATIPISINSDQPMSSNIGIGPHNVVVRWQEHPQPADDVRCGQYGQLRP